MSIKYLSPSGLTEVWSNIKAYIASKIPSKIITGLSIKGRTITYTNSDGTTGTLTTQDTNTTYSVATTSTNGLMSSTDKTKLDGIAAGANNYTHPSSHPASMITGLTKVATSGSYNDLSDKPTIPTVNNATLTIQKNGTTVKTFTANASANVTANITVPTKTSELTNNSGFLTSHNPVDSSLSSTSTNAIQNKVVNAALNNKANDSDVVHKSGGETIAGLKTFDSWQIINYGLNVKWITGNKEQKALHLFGSMDDKYQGFGSELKLCGDDANYGKFILVAQDKTKTNVKIFVGLPDGTLTWDGKTVLTAGNGVTVDTAQTIAGVKTFSNVTYSNKELRYKDTKYDWTNTSLDTWCDAGHVSWSDKTGNRRMHELVGTKGGVWHKSCYINEKPYFSVNSNRDITYWGTTIAFHGTTTFTSQIIGNISGNASTATYATTQATSDNSTKIATTAWVRTYVNSAVGSGSVGTTITAYWGSSSSTGDKWATASGINGTKRVSSTTNTFTPVVGQIYSGNQLYNTATANGSVGDTGAQSPTPKVVYARLDLSGAFNSSYKYLCTTAVGVNAKATVDVTGHTTYTSSGPYTTITSYTGFTKAVYGGKSTFLRVQ